MKIAVLGAGAWGTALAVAASARHQVVLWARDAAQAAAMRSSRRNSRYLDEVVLPPSVQIESDLQRALRHGDGGLFIIATPMGGLRTMLEALPANQPVAWLSKGFEGGSGRLGHEIAESQRPGSPCAVLSGPSFAQEVARGQATALVAAGVNEALLERLVDALHSDTLRLYTSNDIVGVEVGGAVKNVLAIATGIVDGLASSGVSPGASTPGLNARAALITRGLAEMTRLGVALGARAETFMGLSGLGDLVLTATGALSRNRQVGLRLAAGEPLPQVLAGLGHVAEGVYSASTALGRARELGVEMPITEAVVEVLEGRLAPASAIRRLMTRQPRAEHQLPPA